MLTRKQSSRTGFQHTLGKRQLQTMRDYPSIPNVFRVGSGSSINLLHDKQPVHSCPDATRSQQEPTADLNHRKDISTENLDSLKSLPDGEENVNSNGRNYRSSVGSAFRELGYANDANGGGVVKNNCVVSNNSNANVATGKDFHQCHNSSVNDLNPFELSYEANYSAAQPGKVRGNAGAIEKDNRGGYLLWIVTPVAASMSVAIVVAALAGPQWLFTEEKLPNANYNGTANFNAKDDGAFITKYTKSSLWILCSTLQGMESYNCIKVDYFPKEEYRPDPHDSTLAIPYTITKSSVFFLISAIFLLISFLVFLVATCSHQNSLYYFASGILFIVSGLLMLIGLIVYISIFKAEVGSKLRPKSTLQPPLFTFSYGQSFFLYVFGFISTEFVGVLNIFLYISLQQVGQRKTIPCLSFISTHEKIIDVEVAGPRNSFRPYEDRSSSFVCRKHSSISTKMFPYLDTEHRYYFEKPQKCNLHSKNLAKSLNELYTEPAPTFSPFDLPHEFPLTRSVSTTTELFSNSTNNVNNNTNINNNIPPTTYNPNEQSPTITTTTLEKRNKKNQTNVEDDYSSRDSLNDICGLSRTILGKGRKSKDELFNEFCRKAGMRPKPKDIYYIEDNSRNDEEENIFIVDNYATLTKNRRNSFMEPRKRNSNFSLRTLDKVYPKSLFDLDRCDSDQWNNYSDHYLSNKSNSRDLNVYQSRTLPRSFMKRNYDMDNNAFHREHRRSLGFEGSSYKNFYSSENMLHKSFDEMNMAVNFTRSSKQSNSNLQVQWPTAIPTSPSGFSAKSTYGYNDQTGYYSKYNFCRPQQQQQPHQQQQRYKDYSQPPPHQPHGFYGTFDLDRIERERRKSHASLFEASLEYDIVNGTAV